MLRVVAAFPDRRAAFEILKAAALNPIELLTGSLQAEELADLVKLRAVMSLAQLAPDVPEAVPLLWELFRSEENIGDKNPRLLSTPEGGHWDD